MASPEERPSRRPPGGPEALIGTTLAGRYRIEKLLGEGGMGAVYLAEHEHIRKRIAIKVLHAEMSRLPEVVARFEREAMAAAHIEHPHVAAATDFGKLDDGSFFLVLEYIEGRSLRDVVAQGPLDWERAFAVARQIGLALSRAHALGIVHRDLKPENVMLVEKDGDPDFVKVLDFGIAKVPVGELVKSGAAGGSGRGQPALTQLGMVYGTPEYMAPEQALGQNVDARADLYSLGVMLFEMLAGVRPFEHASKVTLLGMHVTAPVPWVSDKNPRVQIPEDAEAIIRRCLEKESGRRYEGAKEMVAALERALGIVAPLPPTSMRRPSAPDNGESYPSSSPSTRVLVPGALPASLPLGSPAHTAQLARAAHAPTFLNSSVPSQPISEASSVSGPLDSSLGLAPGGGTKPPDVVAGAKAWALAALGRRPGATAPVPKALVFSAVGAGSVFVVGLVLLLALGAGAHKPSALDEGGVATSDASAAAVDPALASELAYAQQKFDEKRYDEAAAMLVALSKKAPERAAVHALLERVYAATKRGVDAVDEAKSATRLDPQLRESVDLQVDLRNIALGVAGKDAIDSAFTLLERSFGEVGPDILYDIAYGAGAKSYKDAATRARLALERADVRELESPALRVTVDLLDASGCAKVQKLASAGELGDARTVAALKQLKEPVWVSSGRFVGGGRRSDALACLHSDGKLDAAIAAIESRGTSAP